MASDFTPRAASSSQPFNPSSLAMEKQNVMRAVINTEGEKEESTTPSVSKCPNPVVVEAE
jgi:hypothetical protein